MISNRAARHVNRYAQRKALVRSIPLSLSFGLLSLFDARS